ncbi:methylenetetrahydrofolate reductase [Desnuesiella massiliensis]|uniref:methylenetetrahydrofolate reductase n=1 Tax=Desnuesiella massiliensis TaxID=1650662 RepID=UPI0006E2C2DD|nr:methylenetetrahydrofolate reductase [Desnuesiella massiliensis]
MKISQLFKSKNVVFSFEVFPPKPVSPLDTVYDTLKELKDLKPDFISVTYGAGGSIKDNKTCELSSFIKDNYGIETLAHLTCINSTRENIELILKDLRNKGIENILALRGDVPKDGRIIGEYNSAYELINQIKTIGGFGIGAACYPEGHVEHKDTYGDILELKRKVEKGAEHLISQLFFDNNIFYNFLETTEKENINIPIQAGIMPVVNNESLNSIISSLNKNIAI